MHIVTGIVVVLAPMLLRKGAVGQRLLDRCLDELDRFGVCPEGSGRERGHHGGARKAFSATAVIWAGCFPS